MRKILIIAAALASLSAASVISTEASAHGFHGGGHFGGGMHFGGGHHFGPGRIMGGHFEGGHRWGYHDYGYRRFGFGGYGGFGGGSCWKWSYTYGRRVNVCG